MNREQQSIKKISALVKHFQVAYPPYAGIKLPLKNVRDLQQVPILAKADLLQHKVTTRIREACYVTATSGSTSDVMLIAHSKACHLAQAKRMARAYLSIGWEPGELCLNTFSYLLNAPGRIVDAALKTAGVGVISYGVFDTPARLDELAAIIKAMRPTLLHAYTNQLFELFTRLGKDHTIRSCVVAGEPLMPSYQRNIEQMGGIKVHNLYGCNEFSGMAMAQDHRDEYLKLFDDDLYVEVLKDDGTVASTGSGAIILSDLNNRSMPFIRYKLGDRVDIRRRGTARYVKVLGRLSDSLLMNGEVFFTREIEELMDRLLGHPRFFFKIDKDPLSYRDVVTLNLPPEEKHRAAEIGEKVRIALALGRTLKVNIASAELLKTTSGKLRHVLDTREGFQTHEPARA